MSLIIMKTKRVLLFNLLLTVFLIGISGIVFVDAQNYKFEEDTYKTTINYFYISKCHDCKDVKRFLSRLEEEYALDENSVFTKVTINKYNIEEKKNLELIRQYFEEYNVPDKKKSVPLLFIGDKYFFGEKEIREKLIGAIKSGDGLESIKLQVDIEDIGKNFRILSSKQITGVAITGLINGLNPCSISMLLFLFSLIVIEDINVLEIGLSYIAGKFITYLLLGTLLFNVFVMIDYEWFNYIIKVSFLIIAILMAALNISDYFVAKEQKLNEIKLQLPVKLRKFNHKLIKKINTYKNKNLILFASFILGIIISIGEFLCTGQIYLATIVHMVQSSTELTNGSIIYFLIYCLAFIIPLLVLTVIIYRGKEIFDVSDLIGEKMHYIKLINAIVFIGFAIYILLWF